MRTSSTTLFYWVVGYVAIAFFGFGDSVYLTASHYMGGVPVCTVLEGCDEVALSEYATIGSIPVALFGVLFYTGMLIAGFLWLDTRNSVYLKYLPFVTVPAFLFSMWLVYLMIYVIEALCLFCFLSAGSTTLLMLISFRFRRPDV
jgi:uncharacterized membrane protein